MGNVSTYHYKIVYKISKENFTESDIEYFETFYKKIENFNLNLEELLYPRLKIDGEVLVPYNKELLELLSNLKDTNNTKLLLNNPPFNQSSKNFRLADFRNCIMVKSNFFKSNLQGASLYKANLQGAYFKVTNLKGANLEDIDTTPLTKEKAKNLIKIVSLHDTPTFIPCTNP